MCMKSIVSTKVILYKCCANEHYMPLSSIVNELLLFEYRLKLSLHWRNAFAEKTTAS